jgi:hypothetical protein
MQDNLQEYSYTCVEPVGTNFDPAFKPPLTPKQMFELGVFGGNYFEGFHDEYPKEWFKKAKLSKLPRTAGYEGWYDKNCNYFRIKASQSRDEWIRKGWMHKDDPRGWFQWYCRYYLGRRHEDDARQIDRWVKMTRHIRWLQNACEVGNIHCRPRQRQVLLHWAYDSRKL